MPSADANRLTRQHRDIQAAIGIAVVRPVRQMAQRAPTSNMDGWFESILVRLLRIIRAAWLLSRSRADSYLREHARIEGVTVEPSPALWVPPRVIASARVTGPVAFKQYIETFGSPEGAHRAMVQRLTASAQRQALAGGRETIARTVARSDAIVGWRRVTDADPCAFCALLASRGAVYSKHTVRFHAHDGDECTFEPLYEHEDEPPGVADLYQQWLNATKGHSGKAAIREWRRYWDSRDIAAQRKPNS